jgi:hypothetical protein
MTGSDPVNNPISGSEALEDRPEIRQTIRIGSLEGQEAPPLRGFFR